MNRKPIEPGCTFSIDCPIDGHVTATRNGRATRYAHTKLTLGQRKTRREQWLRDRAATNATDEEATA